MNDKGFKVGVLVALIAMIVVVGVGFAAFTTTLNINGTAKVEASSWKVKFAARHGEDLGDGKQTTETYVSNTQTGIASTATVVAEPTLTDTTINDWSVTFKTPGDSVRIVFSVQNQGTFDAKVSSLKLPTPVCTGTGDNAEVDAENVCKHLEYKLTTSDDAPYTEGTVLYYFAEPEDESKPWYHSLHLTLTYKDDVPAEELPKGEVTISNLGFSIVYTQA